MAMGRNLTVDWRGPGESGQHPPTGVHPLACMAVDKLRSLHVELMVTCQVGGHFRGCLSMQSAGRTPAAPVEGERSSTKTPAWKGGGREQEEGHRPQRPPRVPPPPTAQTPRLGGATCPLPARGHSVPLPRASEHPAPCCPLTQPHGHHVTTWGSWTTDLCGFSWCTPHP